jgi:putative ABC transport system substrate-binding protein
LGTLGYVEGQNILIEWRDAEIGAGRISEVVVELVGLPVDVLVVSSNDGAQAAKQATDRVPIVCTALVPSAEC